MKFWPVLKRATEDDCPYIGWAHDVRRIQHARCSLQDPMVSPAWRSVCRGGRLGRSKIIVAKLFL